MRAPAKEVLGKMAVVAEQRQIVSSSLFEEVLNSAGRVDLSSFPCPSPVDMVKREPSPVINATAVATATIQVEQLNPETVAFGFCPFNLSPSLGDFPGFLFLWREFADTYERLMATSKTICLVVLLAPVKPFSSLFWRLRRAHLLISTGFAHFDFLTLFFRCHAASIP